MMRLVVLKKGLVAGHYRTIHGKRTFVSPYSDRRMRHTGPLDPKQATLFGGEADEAQGKLFGGPVADAAQKQAQALIDAHGGDVGEALRHHKENAQVAHHLGEQKPEDVATHVATAAALKEKGEGEEKPAETPMGESESRSTLAAWKPERGQSPSGHSYVADAPEHVSRAAKAALSHLKAKAEELKPHAKGDDRKLLRQVEQLHELHPAEHLQREIGRLAPAVDQLHRLHSAPSTPPPSNVVSLADARARRDAMASAQAAEAEKMGAKKAAHTAEHMKHLRAGDRIVMDGRARRIDDREDPAHAQRGMALLGNGQHMSHDEIAQRLNDGSAKLENHLARPIGVEELESRRDAGPATHAHISFVHTDGLNDKASIERRGKSVLVKHGQNTYKVSAHDFDQNKSAIRGSYVIKPWTMDSERRKKNESNDHW